MTLLAAAVLSWSLSAQTPILPQKPLTFGSEIGLVILHATAVTSRGKQVSDLDQTAFTVIENGKRQAISLFRHDVVPVSVGLLLDTSRSMSGRVAEIEAAARAAIVSANPEDEMFLIHFADKARIDVEMTRDGGAVSRAVPAPTAGGTGLRDALALAETYLAEHATHERRLVIVISDGNDNASEIPVERLKDAFRRDKVSISAIGILDFSDPAKAGRGRDVLANLAESTNGILLLPETHAQVAERVAVLSADLRHMYTIGYSPIDQALDGSYRRIEVRAKGQEKLRVNTRDGYQATPSR